MRKGNTGWFVEVPVALKEEFKKLYPGRAAQRRLTVAAIEWAIRAYPTLTEDSSHQTTKQQDGMVRILSILPMGIIPGRQS